MIVRFGYVAMSVQLENASPSRTMTMSNFSKLPDREAGLRRLEQLARENLRNTLRLLKHNRYMDVRVYRFSSKLIPLATHPSLSDWDPYAALAEDFAEVGAFVREHGMRVSFHPDHFTVLSTPRQDVFEKSVNDLRHHVKMFELMGLDERAANNIHVGGTYGDKEAAGRRFVEQFQRLEDRIARRMTLENDDKTFTASETLVICERVGVPMVLDLHHHAVNNPSGDQAERLWPRILRTWERRYGTALPPKIHVSSPKSESDPRGHADYVEAGPLIRFLRDVASDTPALDVMIEAKRKDESLFRLLDELRAMEAEGAPLSVTGGASIEVPSSV
ncbi:UV DNA damage repair endonuclease UvsE [Cohnella sp. CFH 77786]|uniref:UV DNA damage repair endonuclease UvsE n=1 Tax=Cohnella sp. CFH 77786 TaxID=2662265 RepID=UPI001C60E9FC|nr:UV DNA damage repair endonuclease UvsE [Cohnella sp. CFH 77786]MBW5445650.1 UV DNA damage repair endonuclease UvsE [Cohnella sp. CFH 77786]